MLENFKEDSTKHIVIILKDNPTIDTLACGSALYSYFLSLHKKVSFYCSKFDFDLNLNFIPWIDKLKTSYPSSADCIVEVSNSIELFEYFMSKNIKLNVKMATSLYAGLIDITSGFKKAVNGTVFAMAEVLVQNKAKVSLCNENLLNYQSLATLRLKIILLNKLELVDEGSLAVFKLDDNDLIASGAKMQDAHSVINESLGLPTVKKVVVIYKGKEIIKEGI
ncbi:MAG: hypothetical protein L3I99_04885 [Sulfurimonas sp.]|nr:hypothetical protein [Sulfurimonas sp.]